MNADNLMSINCNRIYRNQFLDELTAITAFSAQQLAKYTNSIFVSQIYRMAILSGKERASKIANFDRFAIQRGYKNLCVTHVAIDKRTMLSSQSVSLESTIKNYSATR